MKLGAGGVAAGVANESPPIVTFIDDVEADVGSATSTVPADRRTTRSPTVNGSCHGLNMSATTKLRNTV